MNLVIVVPALNEEKILKSNIENIVGFCLSNLVVDWRVVIVDNNSTDATAVIGQELAKRYAQVGYVHTLERGKGIAIKAGWQSVDSDKVDIYCFMDADLATDISALSDLVRLMSDGADCVIGSRFAKGSKVKRTFLRSVFSQGYRFIAKIILGTKIDDLPCGFKAINKKVFEDIIPQVKSKDWFFDSEMIILAERSNFKIVKVPIVWEDIRPEGDKSRVKILSLSLIYFKKLIDLRQRLKI